FFYAPATPEIYTLSYTTLFRSEDLVEHGLIERPGPVGIGIGERRPPGNRRPQMRHLALATRQAAADLAQRMGTSELGKQHRHELDRKSTRLNSSHRTISYAVFC